MRASDLMIGDWLLSVIDRYDHVEKKPCRVTGIRIDGSELIQADDTDVWYSPCTYEPIPITPEFLEKNFEKKVLFGIFDDYFDMEIHEINDGLFQATYHSCEMSVPDQSMTLCYVHELQHFLTHCAIEKEVVL